MLFVTKSEHSADMNAGIDFRFDRSTQIAPTVIYTGRRQTTGFELMARVLCRQTNRMVGAHPGMEAN